MENCVKSRKFIANRTNEYFILACITSYVWKFRSQINQYFFPVFSKKLKMTNSIERINRYRIFVLSFEGYTIISIIIFGLPRETKTIEIFQISIFIESAPICGQPIIKLTFKPWFVSVCV